MSYVNCFLIVPSISSKLGNVLGKCSDWLTDNKLSLHLGKTECMLFGPNRKIRQIKTFMRCYEHVITSTEVAKYLGVYIDRYLNFENIVSNIVSKVNKGNIKITELRTILQRESKNS
jgi:hypothetical protein